MDQKNIMIKGCLFVLGLVIIIIVVIMNSYKKWNTDKNEGFEQLTNPTKYLVNSNKTYINNILRLMKQKYPNVDSTLSNYGLTDPNSNIDSPLKLDSTNIDSEYQIKFIQELQDREIANLESNLVELKKILPTKPLVYDSNKVKSVKHIPTGKLFGILKNPNQLGQQISIIIDPKNATCLKKITPPANTKEGELIKNIDLTACDYNPLASGQKFMIETVNDNSQFNEMLAPEEKERYSVSSNYGFGVYPFSVIKSAKPISSSAFDTHIPSTECITLDESGLSIEPCTGKESQRFTPMDISVNLGI